MLPILQTNRTRCRSGFEWDVAAVRGNVISRGTCHVCPDDPGWLPFPTPDPDEKDLPEMLDQGCPGASRLSCQPVLSGDHDGIALALAQERNSGS